MQMACWTGNSKKYSLSLSGRTGIPEVLTGPSNNKYLNVCFLLLLCVLCVQVGTAWTVCTATVWLKCWQWWNGTISQSMHCSLAKHWLLCQESPRPSCPTSLVWWQWVLILMEHVTRVPRVWQNLISAEPARVLVLCTQGGCLVWNLSKNWQGSQYWGTNLKWSDNCSCC